MSRAPPSVAALLPPVPRAAGAAAPVQGARGPRERDPAAAGAAPFDLAGLALLPRRTEAAPAERPQRAAWVEAEETRGPVASEAEETPVQPELEVGPVDDPYEREADEIADTAMREPAPEATATADDPGPRRACAACEAEDTVRRDDAGDAEGQVRRETVAEAEAASGPPTLAASPAVLTSGGAPLSDDVRGFYEQRLGRDLSAVRLHQGPAAQALSETISARAFTYGSHIWMGAGGGGAAPSHTLGHEIAHVLQQTQPQPLRREALGASATATAVRRRHARWVPHRSKTLTKSQGASHDLVVELVSKDKANADLLAEVPIPNAGRRYSAGKSFGFADFVKAAPQALPGVWVSGAAPPSTPQAPPATGEEEEAVPGDPAAPDRPDAQPAVAAGESTVASPPDSVIANFDEEDWTPEWLSKLILAGKAQAADQARPMQGGRRFDFTGKQHPRVAGGKLVGVAQAPRQMALGELKPGHNMEAGEKAFTQQLPRYRRGLDKVSAGVNAVDVADRDAAGNWSLALSDLAGIRGGPTGLHIPEGLHPRSKKPAIERELVLVADGKKIPTADPVRGHLALGPHPTHPGVWSYLYVPSKAPSSKTLTQGQRKGIKTLEKTLRDLIAKLKKTPTSVRRQRRRPEEPRAVEARRLRRSVRRKVRKDEFDRPKWEADRQAFAAALRDWKSTDPDAPATIEHQADSREAFLEIAQELKGFSPPPLSAQALADIRLLRKLERVADPKFGKLLGTLREKFGSVFVRLASAYDDFRDRLGERLKGAPKDAPAGIGGGWRKKAVRLLIAAAVTGAKLLARQVVANIAACIDALADKLLAKFEGELEETFEAEIEALVEAFDNLRARIEAELEPFLARFDALFATLSSVAELAPIISDIITTARIAIQAAACLSPPLKGCLWGLVAQVGIEGALGIAVDQDWFKEAVINPIARGLIDPIADEAYRQILDLVLGGEEETGALGGLRQIVAATPACRPPKRSSLYKWSGAGGNLPTRDPHHPGREAREMMEQWEAENAEAIDRGIKDALRNKDGGPVSDEQVQALLDAIAESGLTPEALQDAMRRARKGGKVDPEAAREAVEAEAEATDAEIVTDIPAPGGPGGDDKAPAKDGVEDLERADQGFSGGGESVSWYGRLETPASGRKAGGEVHLTLFFPKAGRPTFRFPGVAVTFVEILTGPETEGGPEFTWLRFRNAAPIYLRAKDGTRINIEAQEWDIRLAGEPAPAAGGAP